MINLVKTVQLLQAHILNNQNFIDYYKIARQTKNLNGYKYFIKQWLNHLKDNPQFIPLLDKPYEEIPHIIIMGDIIDLASLYVDYKSDLRSYYGLNPKGN